MASRDPAQRRQISSLGGLGRAARESPAAMLAAANRTYRDSFRKGHQCAMCPAVEIPQDLPAAEIDRRAQALFSAHMKRVRMRRQRAQQLAEDAAAEVRACDEELADIASAS